MGKVTIDPQSACPLHTQIKEHVKLALAFGELQPGDTLPSIREVARELQIGAGVVRRAYSELVQAGILSVSRSKRVVVNNELMYRHDGYLLKETQQLAPRIFDQAFALGVHPQSFAQFFQHWLLETRRCEQWIIFAECNRMQAEQYAEEAARAWGVPVQGMTFDALRQLSPANVRATRYIVTVPYHYEEAREIARRARKDLVTISVNWDEEVLQRIGRLQQGGQVAFVFDQLDCERYGRLIVKEMQERFPEAGIAFTCVAIQEVKDVARWIDETNRDLIFFSNRLWESLPAVVQSRANVLAPRLRIDPVSLERVRIEVGVLS